MRSGGEECSLSKRGGTPWGRGKPGRALSSVFILLTTSRPLDVRFVSIVSRLGLDTLYLIVSTGAHLYLESTTYHHYYYTTRGAAAGAPIGISGSGTTSLLPPSERVAMFAPRRARSGLGFATGGIAADCRPCRVQVRYFIPQYTLYLCICHCICIVSRLGLDTLYHSVSTDTLHCI